MSSFSKLIVLCFLSYRKHNFRLFFNEGGDTARDKQKQTEADRGRQKERNIDIDNIERDIDS